MSISQNPSSLCQCFHGDNDSRFWSLDVQRAGEIRLVGKVLFKRVSLACCTQKGAFLLGLKDEHKNEMLGDHFTGWRRVVSG